MLINLIDTHCHLDFSVFDEDRDAIVSQCKSDHISSIIVPGVCQNDWQQLLSTCAQYDSLFPALGLHPCFLQEHHRQDIQRLSEACERALPIAIGEIGLDFFILKNIKDASEKEQHKKQQIHYFSQQLKIASQYQLPVLIHARKSHDEVIRQLKAISPICGIIHAYSGSYEQAKDYLKLDFKLGFGGAFTYPNASKLRALVNKLPLDAWVLETDAPDMSPVNHYGQRNSPQYLSEIAQVFVQLYDSKMKPEQVLLQLHKNTLELFPQLSQV